MLTLHHMFKAVDQSSDQRTACISIKIAFAPECKQWEAAKAA